MENLTYSLIVDLVFFLANTVNDKWFNLNSFNTKTAKCQTAFNLIKTFNSMDLLDVEVSLEHMYS